MKKEQHYCAFCKIPIDFRIENIEPRFLYCWCDDCGDKGWTKIPKENKDD